MHGSPSVAAENPEGTLSTSPRRRCRRSGSSNALLERRRRTGKSQWIIATHSPILLAYPERDLFLFTHRGLRRAEYDETPHAQLYAALSRDPVRYVRDYLANAAKDET